MCNQDGYVHHTFESALQGKTNRITLLAFADGNNISDNPFNGTLGYALVFQAGIIHLPTVFDSIGILLDSSEKIQYARIRIS